MVYMSWLQLNVVLAFYVVKDANNNVFHAAYLNAYLKSLIIYIHTFADFVVVCNH